MPYRHMKKSIANIWRAFPSLREPIVGWLLLLIAISFGTTVLILAESYLGEKQRHDYQNLVEQQRAKRALGDIIHKDILLLGHHLHHMTDASDKREVRILQAKASNLIASSQNTLRVLSSGGAVTDVMPANFENVDEIQETIVYRPGQHESIVVEVVELSPLLVELSKKIDGLAELACQRFEATDASARHDIDNTIAFHLKTACATTMRARERANKIYHDTATQVARLEQRANAATWRMKLARYLTVGTSAALVAVVGVLILMQIVHLLKKRRQSEDNLIRSRATFQMILENIPVGVTVIGQDRKVRKANTSALKLMGYPSEESILGKICHESLCPSKKGKCPIFDLGKQVDHAECVLVSKDGQHIPILKTVIPVTLGEETVLLEAFLDITKQKQNEQELNQYRKHLETLVHDRTAELAQSNQYLHQEIRAHQRTEVELKQSANALKSAVNDLEELKNTAEAANQAKSEFLANMSHEIRTPMTSVLGYADLLRAPDISEEDRHTYAETIRRNGQALLNLINNILDLSKIEVGKMTADKADCSAVEILDEAISIMRPVAIDKGLQLQVHHEFPIPKSIQTDPGRLRQILLNLIGNAIKFTASGHVHVSLRLSHPPGKPARLQFTVEDTGIGMTAEQLQDIFRPFTQVDSSASRRYGGTGLGLVISKKLAKMLDGDVEVHSEVGKGSTFTLTIDPGPLNDVVLLESLPVASEASEPVPQCEKPQQQLQGRVLLAEDGPDNQRLICLVLKKSGLQIELAENGKVACEKARQSASDGNPYDLILMDMQMPEMDGYEATRLLREEGWQRPIIALTAHAMAGDREKCILAGCDDYLSKPIDRERLLGLIADCTAANHSQPSVEEKIKP